MRPMTVMPVDDQDAPCCFCISDGLKKALKTIAKTLETF